MYESLSHAVILIHNRDSFIQLKITTAFPFMYF